MLLTLLLLSLCQSQLLSIHHNRIILLIIQHTLVINSIILHLFGCLSSSDRCMAIRCGWINCSIVFLDVVIIITVDNTAAALDVMHLVQAKATPAHDRCSGDRLPRVPTLLLLLVVVAALILPALVTDRTGFDLLILLDRTY